MMKYYATSNMNWWIIVSCIMTDFRNKVVQHSQAPGDMYSIFFAQSLKTHLTALYMFL
jgi:hypothetical protein